MAIFTLKRGDSWVRHIPVQDQATGALRSLIDDPGPPAVYARAAAQFRVKATRALGLALDDDPLTGTGGLTLSDYSVRIDITAAQSAALSVARHAFDVQVTWADGTVQSAETHYLDIEQDYTYQEAV